MSRHDEELAESLRDLTLLLVSGEELAATLQRVADLSVQTIPGCTSAAITLRRGETLSLEAASGDGAGEAADAEARAGDGPSYEACRTAARVRIDHLAVDARWPSFVKAAREGGLESCIAVPLCFGDDVLGCFLLGSVETEGFDPIAEDLVSLFAVQCAVAVSTANMHDHARELAGQMEQALTSRAVIDQAKGIVMARRGCDPDTAFEFLVEVSQRTNTKLRDVAAGIVREVVDPGH